MRGEPLSPHATTEPARRARRRGRWRLWTVEAAATGVVLLLAAVGLVLGYASSVPLPADPAVPQASILYYSDGRTELARLGVTSRADVPLRRVPAVVRRAVLAAEDQGFYGHDGISARGVARATVSNVVKGVNQGGSTITQQYARNAYLTQERSVGRKAKEAVLAVKIERRYTKDEILERYLNTIYFGRGAYGIGAAAIAFFGTSVDRLTLAQGAVLAAVIKDPYHFDPAVDPAAAADRWRWIIDSMAELRWVDPATARATGYPPVVGKAPGAQALAGPLGLVVDQVERELAGHGISPQRLRTGGLAVVTTIDAGMQAVALDRVRATLRGQPDGLRAALVAVDPANGAVRAYYGGDRGSGFFDDAAAPRPPASTFKPVVLAEGLAQGISYRSRWDGSSPRTFHDRYGVPLHNRDDSQCPDCTLDTAMAQSLNTPFYALAERVSPAAVRTLAVRMGIPATYQGRKSLVDEPGAPEPGRTRADIALGRYPVAPLDLASVYATLAAGGWHTGHHFVESVTGTGGHRWYQAHQARTRVLAPAAARDVTSVLAGAVEVNGLSPGRPAAGKTGTQQYGNSRDSQDAWMAGYTPQLAAVVWIGRAVPGPIRDRSGRPIEGDGLPAALWAGFLRAALAGVPVVGLPGPAGIGDEKAGDARTGSVHNGGIRTGDPRDRNAPARAGADRRPDAKASAPAVKPSGPPSPAAQLPSPRRTKNPGAKGSGWPNSNRGGQGTSSGSLLTSRW